MTMPWKWSESSEPGCRPANPAVSMVARRDAVPSAPGSPPKGGPLRRPLSRVTQPERGPELRSRSAPWTTRLERGFGSIAGLRSFFDVIAH